MTIVPIRDWPVLTRIAGIALVAALVLDLAVLLHTSSAEASASAATLKADSAPRIATHTRVDDSRVREATRLMPFDITPTAAELAAVSRAPITQPTSQAILPKLVGTVLEEAGGGFVIVETPDTRIHVVRIGERIGDLRLRAVQAGEAAFDDLRGTRITLRTAKAGQETRP